MTFRNLLILSVVCLCLAGCDKDRKHTEQLVFTNDTLCPITPVKDQGRSSACWIYAMLATIESEHITRGDSVNLSPHYVIYRYLARQAERCYLTQGQDSISLRGTINMLPDIIHDEGLMPYDSYRSRGNTDVTVRKLTALTYRCIKQRLGMARLREAADDMLQQSIAPVPPHVYMYGVEYTPQEFAHSVCMPDEYTALTSYTHHPYNRYIDLELSDNKTGKRYYNIPIDKLIHTVINTLSSGRPVCWEGDISEPGFDFGRGVALLEDDRPEAVTQQTRQKELETFSTTDDHCMELIGLAHDQKGRQYVVCKNSWGTDNPYGGIIYMSMAYLKAKTIAVMVNNTHRI